MILYKKFNMQNHVLMYKQISGTFINDFVRILLVQKYHGHIMFKLNLV